MRFVNVRLFKHAIELIRGKYDSPNQIGEVTHFQALTTALSATVGLGTLFTIGIGTGGPGRPLMILSVSWDVFQIYGMYPWAKIQKSSERWSNNGGCHALCLQPKKELIIVVFLILPTLYWWFTGGGNHFKLYSRLYDQDRHPFSGRLFMGLWIAYGPVGRTGNPGRD